MKKRLMNNIGLKIVALLFAAILWLVVVIVNDPVEKIQYHNITVQMRHEELITNKGKTYRIVDDSQNITVTVAAKRSVLAKISRDDIRATADIKDMQLSSLVPIAVSIPGYEGKYKTAAATPVNVQISIEESTNVNFPINASVKGSQQDGYILGDLTVEPKSIQISGPKSLVGRIDKVVASVNVDGLSRDETLNAELILYDGGGNVIDQTLLSNNLGDDGVKVNVTLLSTKQVSINVDTSGVKTSPEYQVSEVTCEPQTITVAGKKTDLDRVNSIDIPASAVAADNISSKTEKTIDISEYLPENVKLADENAKNVVVTISVERLGMKTFDLPVDSISKNNVPDGYKISYGSVKEIELHFAGDELVLNKLDMEQVALITFIDLKEIKKEGTYKLPVQVNLPDGCSLVDTVQVEILVEKQTLE